MMAPEIRPLVVAALCGLVTGCASLPKQPFTPPPQAVQRFDGSYYQVQRGDTLWRIARAFGLDVKTLAGANRLPDPNRLELGQQLFIPLPRETATFLWPVRGQHQASGTQGLKIVSSTGSLVRASRSGRVAVATQQLVGWGQTVVLDHADGYVTVYSGLEGILIVPGATVRQGRPIGRAGDGGVHFQIRRGNAVMNPLALLPSTND